MNERRAMILAKRKWPLREWMINVKLSVLQGRRRHNEHVAKQFTMMDGEKIIHRYEPPKQSVSKYHSDGSLI